MSEFITDRDLSSIGETNMAACAGLTITNGGVNLNRSELPQAVTEAGTLSNEDESSTPVVYLNFVDKEAWSEGKIATAAELIAFRYSKFKLSIVTEKPSEGEFYTICIGTTEALKEYTASQGLVFDPENTDASSGIGFAVVEHKEHSALSPILLDMIDENTIETDELRSIGYQLSALLADECPGISEYSPVTVFSEPTSPVVYLSFVDGEMWSEKKQARTIELLQGRCKEKGVSVTFVTEKPESGKYSTVYVGAASVLKAYGADEDLSKQDYSDGVAYANTNTGILGNKEYVVPQEINEIAEQISNLTEIDLSLPPYQQEDYLMQNNDSIVYLDFVDEAMWSENKISKAIELLRNRCKEKGVSVTFVTEKPESGKYSTVYVGAASVLKAYGADEDLGKQDYSDGVAYADTDMGRFGNKDIVLFRELNAIAEQINQLTSIDLRQEDTPRTIEYAFQDNESSPIVNEIVVTLADDDAKNIFGLFGPGPRSITLIDTDDAANRNEIVVTQADDNISVVTVLLSSNEKSYIVIRDNDPSKSYKLYRVSDYINPETGRLEDLPIPLIAFKNDDSADITVTDTTTADKNNLPTGDVIDEDEKAFLNQILEKARAGISKNENNLPTGYIVIDPMPDSVKEKIIVAIEAYKEYPKMDPLDDDLPSGYVFTTEYTEEFEEKLKKAMESYFNAPIRRDPDDTRVAFISTVDAETEAVTSVQVASAEDDGWRTIGTLNNPDGIDWKYQAGNLTGSGTASVVWHAQELGALGVWTDGTDNWTAVDGWFDANWSMLGCGDFDGDGKDSVLMSLNGGLFYSVDLDGTLTSLGGLNWSGWEFGAVGDFAGDGKDDVVLLHRESGTVVMLADGNADAFERLGQLDASDWSVAGAGDFDADGKDDLLVKQSSTTTLGYYSEGIQDASHWVNVGNGVNGWNIIA